MANEQPDVMRVDPGHVRAFMLERGKNREEKKGLSERHGQHKSNFLDTSGAEAKAAAWIEHLDKVSSQKRQEILRSFDILREHMDGVWSQLDTEDMLGGADPNVQTKKEQLDADNKEKALRKEAVKKTRAKTPGGKKPKNGEDVAPKKGEPVSDPEGDPDFDELTEEEVDEAMPES